MGAQCSLYYSYTVGEPFDIDGEIWEVCPAVRKDDEEVFTVFIHDKEKSQSDGVDVAVKYLKTLRHPGLLKCLELFEESAEIAVVTEAVLPLADVIADLHVFEVIAGIHDIIATLAFLHDKCKLSHNNLSLDSIFVGQNDACWKIAGFENMCPFSDIAKEKLMNETLAYAKDALGLGKLICDILEQIDVSDELSVTNFQQRIQDEFVEASLEKRPEVRSLLNDEVFQNEYCQILDFLRNMTVKSSAAKNSFFKTLHQRLHEVPPHLIANRLLHLLLSRFVLIDPTAVEIFLPHLLTPQSDGHSTDNDQILNTMPLLSENLYRECCIPILRKLFEVNDRHVRLILLKYFHLYVGMFDKDILQSVILPELRLGLQDSDDELVSATFSALQYLVPVVGGHVIIGGERMQQFTERRPKIRRFHRRQFYDYQLPIPTKDYRWKRQILYLSFQFDPTKDTFSNSESGIRQGKQDASNFLTPKVKPSGTKSMQEKLQEKEKRREETRRRNEERRKQRQKAQMERKLAMKAVVEPTHVEEESGNNFDTWDNFVSPEKDDKDGEISDDSEPGRPSSSEISLDSGFSERARNMTEHPASPQSPRKHSVEETNANKFPKRKTNFGMKLGKPKHGNTEAEKGGKTMALKDLAKLKNEKEAIVGNRVRNSEESMSGTNENIFRTNTSKLKSSASVEAKYEDILNSNEIQDNFNATVDDSSLSPSSLSTKNNFTKTASVHGTKSSKAGRSNLKKNTNKSKEIKSRTVVDKSWDDFDIKVKKKDSVMDDIFADMAPTLSETRKAPVKGTSMYSDALAVVEDTTSEDVDGWMNDDW